MYSLIEKNLFVDLILILKDGTNEITMNLHKSIVYSACVYFEKLLTNCKEKDQKCITINVPNVFVTYDIIMSFYKKITILGNLPKWKYTLDSLKCYDFF